MSYVSLGPLSAGDLRAASYFCLGEALALRVPWTHTWAGCASSTRFFLLRIVLLRQEGQAPALFFGSGKRVGDFSQTCSFNSALKATVGLTF